MEKKMTAVMWLEKELDRIERVYNLDEQKSYANEKRIEAFQQALAMEREQMEMSYVAGIDEGVFRSAMDLVNDEYIARTFTDYFTENYKD